MILKVGLIGTFINVIYCLIFILIRHPHDFSFTPRLYIDGPSYVNGAIQMIQSNEWFYPIADIYHLSIPQVLFSYLFRIFPAEPLTIKIFNWLLWCGTIVLVYLLSKKIWKKTHVAWFSCFLYSASNLGQKFVATCQYEIILLFLVSLLFYILNSEEFDWKKSVLTAFLLTGCVAFHPHFVLFAIVIFWVFYFKKVQKKVWLGFVFPLLIGGTFLFTSHIVHNSKNSFFENWFSFRSATRPNPHAVPRPLKSYSLGELSSKYSDFLYYNYLRLPDKWLRADAAGYNFPYPEGEAVSGWAFVKKSSWEYIKLVGRHYRFFWGIDRDIWYIDSYFQVFLGETQLAGVCSFYHTNEITPSWCWGNFVWGSRELNLILTVLDLLLLILGFIIWIRQERGPPLLALSFVIIFILPLFVVGGTVRFQLPLLLILGLLKFQGFYWIWSKWLKERVTRFFPAPGVGNS